MTAYHPTRPRQEPVARSRKEQISDRVTAAINADGLRPWDLAGPQMCRLKFDLLGDAECIINLNPEIKHGALQPRVAEQQLRCSQIAGLLVDLRRFRSAQRMRAICRAIEPGAVRPSMDDAGVLPCRQVWLSPQTAWEQISALASIEGGQPLADSSTGLLGNLELHRPAGLLLNDGRAIANSPTSEHVIDPQADEIAAPELAVDRQIEHRKIASATLHLQPYSNGPDILRLQPALLTDQASPVPWCRRRVGIECSVVIVVSDADHFHLSARSVSTGCDRLTL